MQVSVHPFRVKQSLLDLIQTRTEIIGVSVYRLRDNSKHDLCS